MVTRSRTQSLRITRVFAAPVERVFRAWTDPEELTRWFAPGTLQVGLAEVDLRPGGRYRIHLHGPGDEVHRVVGMYREVVPPRRLVFSWWWESDEEPVETRVTVEFHPLAQGHTQVVVRHERFPTAAMCALHREGWNGCLDKLPAVIH